MTISAQCPHCKRTYNLPETQAGKNAKCKCGQQFSIPHPVVEPELEPLDDDLQLEPLAAAPLSPMPTYSPQRGMQQPAPAFQQPAFQQPAFQQPAFQQASPSISPIAANGLWRAGSLLVMAQGAFLPQHLCIKTGEAAASQQSVKLTWAPAWVHLTLLLGRIVHYAVVSSHGRETTVKVGLSSGTTLKRYLALFGGYGTVVLGFLCFVGFGVYMGTMHQEGDPISILPIFLGAILIGIGGLVAHFGSQLISAAGINNRFIVIRGVSRKLLEALPEWQGEIPRGAGK